MPFSGTELEMIRMVVSRFINSKEFTHRKELVTKFRSFEAVDRLIKVGVLTDLDKYGMLAPTAFGVECSEDPDSVTKARSSLEIVMQALQNLYDVTPPRMQIYYHDVLKEVISIQGDTVREVIERGLYFVKEFSVLEAYGPEPGQPDPQKAFDVAWMLISERIVVVNTKNAWDEHVQVCRATISSITRAAKPVTAASRPEAGVKRWDVFISHASEDKEEIAHPLAEALKKRGFEVWYDEFALKLGDSLRESINRGLAESRFGVVILSKHFFAKHWPNQELNGLAAIEVGGKKVILPVWHGVNHSDVVEFSPILADRKAVSTQGGLERVVAEIETVLNPPLSEDLHDKLRAAEEMIQGYQCPHCASPLSERASVRLSEDDDGLLEAFECGYSHIDGSVQSPCPSDPKFPRLSDFDFVYEEIEEDPLWKWRCFVNGKTREAHGLNLMPSRGRTKDEARERIVDEYNRHAKPWKR